MRSHLTGLIFLGSLVISVALLLIPARREARLHDDLTRAVRMFRIGYASHIVVADFTDFEWDALYIFPYGTTDNEIIARLGDYWPEARNNRLLQQTNFNLLVFVDDDRVVGHAYLPRKEADYATLAPLFPFSPANAVFFLPFEDSPALQVIR